MTRKLALLVAALVIPGGLIALCGAWLVKTLTQTERGRHVVDRARRRVPAWAVAWRAPDRQAA